jgi:hypothetical protein
VNFRLALSTRAQAIIVLALVAAVGALAGVLADRLIAQQRTAAVSQPTMPLRVPPGMGPRIGAGPGEGAAGPGARLRAPAAAEMRYAERLSAMIELTPEQQLAIDSIMTEERRRVRELTEQLQPRFRQIAQETRARVEAVLTAEQREQMRALRRQRMRMPD